MALEIHNLYKLFGDFIALERIDLNIDDGDFVCLLGPSGCGKTTLLRIIAGLLASDGGSIALDGNDLVSVPAKARGFGIVFQSYSLFPHMTIADNIGYGLRIRRTPRAEMHTRVEELLDMVHLGGLGERLPNQLSGGQQQRVAIARALAVNPSLLLLDEPLSALDARVRTELRREIRDVQQRLGIPTLMVTHDQEEAMVMADRVICMHAGRIMQAGSPRELYETPHNRFVAEFMGHGNAISRESAVRLFPQLPATGSQAADALLFVRPERIAVEPHEDAPGRIAEVQFLGGIQRLQVDWKQERLLVETSSVHEWRAGDRVDLRLSPQDCAWIAA